jgi:hypothetical protein
VKNLLTGAALARVDPHLAQRLLTDFTARSLGIILERKSVAIIHDGQNANNFLKERDMKLFALLALATMSLSAFSQTCYVDMVVKNSGRVVRSFTAYGDPNSCIEGMKECRKSIRFDYSNNPQYANGSLDCVRAGDYGPTPNPYPNPQPYPQPHPQPNPYGSVDAISLILDLSSSSYNSEVQTKMVEALILNLNSYSLNGLARVCSSTRTWQENASCLIDGVRRAPRESIDEYSAIHASAQACILSKTWQEEQSCFSSALRNKRLPSLGYLGQSCSGMYNSESAARCYRSVFGVR